MQSTQENAIIIYGRSLYVETSSGILQTAHRMPCIKKEFLAMLAEQPTSGTHGMVATAHYLATQAGLRILQQGKEG